jgi:alcohol dehydrogenase
MPTFQYANPETIHWGKGCLRDKLEGELKRTGARRVFLVTTKSGERDPALAPAVEALLGGRLVGRFAGIAEHAPARSVMEGVHAAAEARADALVSLGGGSPIDATKAVVFSLATGLDLTQPDAPARSRSMKIERALPHFAVPTTLSVAELAGSAGFTAEGTKEKVGVAAPQLKPSAVFYDAELAVRTPLSLWLTTGIRAVDHGVETLLAPGQHPLPDAAALDGLRRLRRGLLAVKKNPTDLDARTECQLGAWHTYLLPGPAAKGLSHTLGKRLGSRHDIPHGVTSCLLLPHVVRYLAPRAAETMKRIAEAFEAPTAVEGISRLIAELELPQHLAAYRLSDAELREAARPVASAENSEDDLVAILRAAL